MAMPAIPRINFRHIAFFSSHGGSGAKAVIQACGTRIKAVPELIISNNPDSPILLFAKEHGICGLALNLKNCGSQEELDAGIVAELKAKNIDLIILSGYMKKLSAEIIRRYAGRIFNIHPALLPKYGGQGMYGLNVHRAVIAAGETETGITIHAVNERYDEGPIIAQMRINVLPGDTPETLSERVKAAETGFLVETLRQMQK